MEHWCGLLKKVLLCFLVWSRRLCKIQTYPVVLQELSAKQMQKLLENSCFVFLNRSFPVRLPLATLCPLSIPCCQSRNVPWGPWACSLSSHAMGSKASCCSCRGKQSRLASNRSQLWTALLKISVLWGVHTAASVGAHDQLLWVPHFGVRGFALSSPGPVLQTAGESTPEHLHLFCC